MTRFVRYSRSGAALSWDDLCVPCGPCGAKERRRAVGRKCLVTAQNICVHSCEFGVKTKERPRFTASGRPASFAHLVVADGRAVYSVVWF